MDKYKNELHTGLDLVCKLEQQKHALSVKVLKNYKNILQNLLLRHQEPSTQCLMTLKQQ